MENANVDGMGHGRKPSSTKTLLPFVGKPENVVGAVCPKPDKSMLRSEAI